MKRRTFMAVSAAMLVFPMAGFAAALDYEPGMVQDLLADGKTVFVDFAADWCSTCKAQERRINSLKSQNANYEANVVFVRVDWDKYGSGDLSKSLNVPRRSTLLVLKGDKELGRVVANTSQSAIKALMDTALKAATS